MYRWEYLIPYNWKLLRDRIRQYPILNSELAFPKTVAHQVYISVLPKRKKRWVNAFSKCKLNTILHSDEIWIRFNSTGHRILGVRWENSVPDFRSVTLRVGWYYIYVVPKI